MSPFTVTSIGQSCAAFDIQAPSSMTDFTRFKSTDGQWFLVRYTSTAGSNRAAFTNTTAPTAAASATLNAVAAQGLLLMPSTLIGTTIASSVYEPLMKFRLVWNDSITNTSGIAVPTGTPNMRLQRRVLEAEDTANPGTVATNFTSVTLVVDSSDPSTIKMSIPANAAVFLSQSPGSGAALTSRTSVTNLDFRPSNDLPAGLSFGNKFYYMISKVDWDNRADSTSISATRRYLTLGTTGVSLRVENLFAPGVIASDVYRTVWRIDTLTSANGTQTKTLKGFLKTADTTANPTTDAGATLGTTRLDYLDGTDISLTGSENNGATPPLTRENVRFNTAISSLTDFIAVEAGERLGDRTAQSIVDNSQVFLLKDATTGKYIRADTSSIYSVNFYEGDYWDVDNPASVYQFRAHPLGDGSFVFQIGATPKNTSLGSSHVLSAGSGGKVTNYTIVSDPPTELRAKLLPHPNGNGTLTLEISDTVLAKYSNSPQDVSFGFRSVEAITAGVAVRAQLRCVYCTEATNGSCSIGTGTAMSVNLASTPATSPSPSPAAAGGITLPVTNGLRNHYYGLDASATSWPDRSGSNRTMTLAGNPTKSGNYVQFNASGRRGTAPSGLGASVTTFTIIAMVQMYGVGPITNLSQFFATDGAWKPASGGAGASVHIQHNSAELIAGLNGSSEARAQGILTTGTPFTLAITYNNGQFTFYKNGNQVGNTTNVGAIPADISTFSIANWSGENRPFNGGIREFALYDRVLTAAEVSSVSSTMSGSTRT